MAILVSGGAGYIGSHTCIELLNAGFDIVVADNYYNASPVVLDRVKQITGKDFRFYQADMTKLTLGVDEESMRYSYLGRKITHEKAKSAYVVIPDVMTKIEMGGDADKYKVEEGIAFSPVYHISLEKKLTKGAAVTWLSLQKEN